VINMAPPEGLVDKLNDLSRRATEQGHAMSHWRYHNPVTETLEVESTCSTCNALLRVNAQNIDAFNQGGIVLMALTWPCLGSPTDPA
jgi:hypothetical protein